jgi:3-oxoadipate enol-lactonase
MSTIVWIHGFPLSSAIFERQLELGGEFPDLPGFGAEPPSDSIQSIDDYARFILDRAPEKATFAGFSMGGYIALAIARLAPERMEGLILIDTRETPDTAKAKKGRYDTIEKVEQQGIAAVVDSMLPKMLGPDAPPSDRDRVREIMNTSSKEGVIAALKAMAERPDSTELLPKLAVPTLIAVGEEDPITPPSDAERMARAIPDARLVRIPRAAHLSNFEQPAVLNAAVRALLNR